MARPREPIDLVRAKGRKHLTKTEYEERKSREVEAPDDNVAPPAYLTAAERRKFRDLAQQLLDIGIMSNLDCDELGRYVRADSEYRKISRQLSKIKFVPDKNSEISPEEQLEEQYSMYEQLQQMQVKAQKQCSECARELGLTISSRCRLSMPKRDEKPPENKFLVHTSVG